MSVAEQEARRRGAAAVEPEHVLLGLVLEEGGVAGYALRSLGVSAERVELALSVAGPPPIGESPPLPWSEDTQRAVARAHEERVPLKHSYVGTEHLVLGVVLSGGRVVEGILADTGVVPEAARREVYDILGHDL
jgi:ATP-dependent Clp protease ATP-binding subunit ClpC